AARQRTRLHIRLRNLERARATKGNHQAEDSSFCGHRGEMNELHPPENSQASSTAMASAAVRRYICLRYFGSSASIKPSPRKFSPITAAMIAAPGKIARWLARPR